MIPASVPLKDSEQITTPRRVRILFAVFAGIGVVVTLAVEEPTYVIMLAYRESPLSTFYLAAAGAVLCGSIAALVAHGCGSPLSKHFLWIFGAAFGFVLPDVLISFLERVIGNALDHVHRELGGMLVFYTGLSSLIAPGLGMAFGLVLARRRIGFSGKSRRRMIIGAWVMFCVSIPLVWAYSLQPDMHQSLAIVRVLDVVRMVMIGAIVGAVSGTEGLPTHGFEMFEVAAGVQPLRVLPVIPLPETPDAEGQSG